jgi:hypothetical protein
MPSIEFDRGYRIRRIIGRDSDVSTRGNLSENSLSKVEKRETEIKLYYSLSHISDPDLEDHFELLAQILLLLHAIHKAKYQLFTPGQLGHVFDTCTSHAGQMSSKEHH